MELETVIGYLVALALPLWLLVEQVTHWQWSSKQPAKRLESGQLAPKPPSGTRLTATRSRAMRLAHPRKT